jgi:uncharacterized protein involved in exopolysaccharide biosynthesis
MASSSSPSFDEERTPGILDPVLLDPMGVVLRRWKLMLVGGLLLLTAFGVAAIRMEPLFDAQATVSVLGARISENFVQTTVEIGTLDQINAIVSQVLSRNNLAEIVIAHELFGGGRDEEPIEVAVEKVREKIVIGTLDDSVARRRGSESSRVYMLSYKDGDPERAAAVANALARSFIDVHLRLRSSEARITTDFLRRELAEVGEELRAQEGLATDFKLEHRGELPGELGTNLARLERLQETRRVLLDQLRVLDSRPATSEVIAADDSPEARVAVLRRRLNESLSLYTPDHPNVAALQRQLEAIEREFGLESSSGAFSQSSAATSARHVRRRLSEVERELTDLDARVARTPRRQEEQEALDRRLNVLRSNYTELLRKVDQAELSESVESAQHGVRVSILDRAVPPTERDGSRIQLMLIGLAAAIALAALTALLLESLDAVVISSEQLELAYSLPVLGNVPHIS